MEFNYELDIEKISKRIIITAHPICKVLPFQIMECGLFHASRKYYTTGNNMDNYLLMYTVSGAGKLVYKNSVMQLTPHTAALIELKTPFHYETQENNWVFKFAQFNGTAAKIYYDLITKDDRYSIPILSSRAIDTAFNTILSLPAVADITGSISASHSISAILTSMLENIQLNLNEHLDERHIESIQKVLNYIAENYDKDLTLEQISIMTNTSKYYFLKLFKKHTGLTPYNYLINYRINQAQRLLKTTDMTISLIAEKVGFSSAHIFIKHFKNIINMTPLQYRKMEQNQISRFVPAELKKTDNP